MTTPTAPRKAPFEPGEPYCRACGEPAEPNPGPHSRCAHCHLHLHHCRHCMFSTPTGCLLRLPYRWPTAGLPGQDCPSFLWRNETIDPAQRPADLAAWRERTTPPEQG
jgi:hypothetical protein